MKLLEINHLKKYFGELEVLKDISMSVEEGEVVSIIGPSGSGKSTLLRCATMLETMNGGDLLYGGTAAVKNGTYASKEQLAKIKEFYGLVFQNFNLFPHYSVMKNLIDAPVHVQKRSKGEVMEEAKQLLEDVGLADKADAYPCQLSGGQQQRVAIARALAMHPQMLFFDEPTSALDPELTTEVLKILRQLAEKKMTMVIVTHEIDFARAVSDRVIFMADGYIVEEGAPADVIDNPRNPRTQAFLRKVQREDNISEKIIQATERACCL